MMLVYASVSFSKTLWLPGQGRHAEGFCCVMLASELDVA